MGRWAKQRERQIERLERNAELRLQGANEVSVTDALRAGEWAGSVRTLAALLFAHQLTAGRFRLDLSDSLLIDLDAGATYFSPATLRRGTLALPANAAEAAEAVAGTTALTEADAGEAAA